MIHNQEKYICCQKCDATIVGYLYELRDKEQKGLLGLDTELMGDIVHKYKLTGTEVSSGYHRNRSVLKNLYHKKIDKDQEKVWRSETTRDKSDDGI
jgi:hypothetical protein